MNYISKVTDITGILLSVYLGICYIPIVKKYYDIIYSPIIPDDGSSWYLTAYTLLVGSIYGFYRSLVCTNNNSGMPIKQWSLGRIVAWPLLLLSFGIYKLFCEAYSS